MAALLLGAGPHEAKARSPESDGQVQRKTAPSASARPTPKRKPTLLPAAQRRNRSSTPPPQTREVRSPTLRTARPVHTAPLPPARDVPGDRGPPLGVPAQYDPRFTPASPPIGYPPLPPTRQVPGESGIPLGPSPLSPVR